MIRTYSTFNNNSFLKRHSIPPAVCDGAVHCSRLHAQTTDPHSQPAHYNMPGIDCRHVMYTNTLFFSFFFFFFV